MRDWENFFNAEDFIDWGRREIKAEQVRAERCAQHANAILRSEIEKAPETGVKYEGGVFMPKLGCFDMKDLGGWTARLICVKKLGDG